MPIATSRKPNRRINQRNRHRVTLTRKQYERLQQELEDLQDAVTCDTAKRPARRFTFLEDFMKELKREGKLNA